MKHLANLAHPFTLSVSGAWGIVSAFTHKYIFDKPEYLIWLIIALSCDLLTGIAKVWVHEGHKAITSKGFRMTVVKFIQYGVFLIITHVLSNVQVGDNTPFAFVKDWACLLLLLIEIKSVYENITAIDNRLDFINPVIKKLGEFINTKKDLEK